MEKLIEPAKRGDSVKPAVERSGTPSSLKYKERTREVGDSHASRVNRSYLRCRTLRALIFLHFVILGFPLCSTPVSMLTSAPRVFGS
jgi:hypothetical protein